MFCDSSCADDVHMTGYRLFHLLIAHADVAPGDHRTQEIVKDKDLLNVYIVSDTVVDVRGKKIIKSLKILYFL